MAHRGEAVQQNGRFDLANLFKELPFIHFFYKSIRNATQHVQMDRNILRVLEFYRKGKNHKGFMKISAELQIFLV